MHSLQLIYRAMQDEGVDVVAVMLAVAVLAVREAEKAGQLTDDRPQLVIDSVARLVAGESTRSRTQRELDDLRLTAEPKWKWGAGGDDSDRAGMFAYSAARHLAGVVSTYNIASRRHRLHNEMIWTRLGAVSALEALGEGGDDAEARVASVIEAAMAAPPARAPGRGRGGRTGRPGP